MPSPDLSHRGGRGIVGLLTDFGQREHYVGVMKAVIAGIAPQAQLIDISHEVPPQDVLAGQWLLRASVRYFPAGTVFLAVVDPGVGTSRRPIALASGGYTFVGPDNGLFTPWLPGEAVELTKYRLSNVSATFHGRDVFSPAAAHLVLGETLSSLGPPIGDPVRQELPQPIARPDGTIEGEIVHVDHFGNLISNVVPPSAGGSVLFGGRSLPLRGTYGAAAPGDVLALVGSEGTVEVAVRDGSASRRLGLARGERITLIPLPPAGEAR